MNTTGTIGIVLIAIVTLAVAYGIRTINACDGTVVSGVIGLVCIKGNNNK